MKRALFVLGTAAIAIAALLALANTSGAGGSEGPRTPACTSKDQLLVMDTQRSGDGPGDSPEDAIDKEIHTLYSNLSSSQFTKTEDSDTGKDGDVEFVHHNGNGQLDVVLESKKIGNGWGVDDFQACNSALQPNNEGGGPTQ